MKINKFTKTKLTERDGNQCAICGTSEFELNIHHITPISLGGRNDLDNLMLLCRRCNSSIGNKTFKEIEFSQYLADLIKSNKEFLNTVIQKRINSEDRKRIIDIYTESKETKFYIEVRSWQFLDKDRVNDAIQQIQEYKSIVGQGKMVLAFPGVLTEENKRGFHEKNIDVWDISFISEKFKDELEKINHPVFSFLFERKPTKPIQLELIENLEKTKSGKSEWSIYQKLLNQILEELFCPPLSNPIYEHADEFKINRRDFILPNYAENGFWSYLRDKYNADFIVIDAKNYTKKVQKKDVLQICNYLKTHGAGLFGIIITRHGGDTSCFHTIKEMWAIQQKLIIVLNDEDIKQMLTLKSVGNDPEEVLKDKIETFRLSL